MSALASVKRGADFAATVGSSREPVQADAIRHAIARQRRPTPRH